MSPRQPVTNIFCSGPLKQMDNPDSSSGCQSEGFNPTARPHIPYMVSNDPKASPSLSPSSASSMNVDTPTSYTSILGSALAKKPLLAVTQAPLPLPEWWGQKYVMVTEGVYIPSPGNAGSSRQSMYCFIQNDLPFWQARLQT